jgi:hypothetical protein
MQKEIIVQCYAGYKADERPTSFSIDGDIFEVEQIIDRWYDLDANYFKVLAKDGNSYLLRHDLNSDSWQLQEPDQNG